MRHCFRIKYFDDSLLFIELPVYDLIFSHGLLQNDYNDYFDSL